MKKSALIFLLLLSIHTLHADFTVNSIRYHVTGTSTVEVTSGGTYTGNITIPSSVIYSATTYAVTSIGKWTFWNCRSLISVTIPSTVTLIEYAAFANCDSLTNVTIPSSVTSIRDFAFEGCRRLTSVTFPTSLISIGYGAFEGCSSLTSVAIPSSVISIGDYAFWCCSNLTNVSIPSSMTTIGVEAFAYCIRLTSVTIPSSVTSIGSGVFSGCIGPINVEESNPNYSSQDGVLYNKDKTTLIQCPVSKSGSFTIPTSVNSIGGEAFALCRNLTNVTIPLSVTSIGSEAFSGCSGPIDVDVNNPNYSSLEGVLYNKSKTTLIHCPVSKSGSFIIPSSVISIGSRAFGGCNCQISVDANNPYYSSLDGVIYNKNKTTLIQCPASKSGSFTIPSSATSIESWAFEECSGLTSVTIPSSVTLIGDAAFANCSSLASIYACAKTPFDLIFTWAVFYNVNITTCILYVPVGSKSLYQAADQWQDFANIVELSSMAVETINTDSIGISYNPATGTLKIAGIEGNALISLYDLNGRLLISRQMTDGDAVSIPTLSQGVYVVKAATGAGVITRKVVVR